MVNDVLNEMKTTVDTAITAFKHDLGKLRTGRASVSILDGIRVDYYGVPTPLNQCATISVTDARMMVVKPFEKKLVQEIDKAIRMANIGINPLSDGDIIRLPIPQLNEERRRDLVKQAKARSEEAKISIRNHRRDANEMLKELEKDKEISKDDLDKALERVQAEVDRGSKLVEEVLATKEKEIMEV